MAYKTKKNTKTSIEISDKIKSEAIALVENEKKTWSDALVYVTEKVAFKIPDLIRTCEKNYWGIFDNPKDKLTNRNKIWYPLSEEVANAWADNSDLDQKDVNFRTKPGGSYAMTQLSRQIMKTYLDDTFFGQDLDDSAIRKGITGTAIWKVIDNIQKGKNKPIRKLVNRLNFFIDPTADSIQSAYRVTERSLMFVDELNKMDGWWGLGDLKSEEGLPLNDTSEYVTNDTSTTVTRDVWELWGKIPKYMVTGNEKDTEDIDGHIVVSGLEAGSPVCHLIEENTNTDKDGNVIKPYEEDWAMKVPGRWDGRGPVEQVMFLQLWINAIINIRINRSYVSQLGLFKIKRTANVTPQSIQKLGANGAVLVSSMDDIEQLITQEASQSSYIDENNIRDIAKRITRTLETITGESLPASTPATNASIQASATKNAFTKIKERSGFFVERLINRHLMAKVIDTTSTDDLIRIINTDNDIDEIIDRIAYYYVDEYQNELESEDMFLTPEQLDIAIQSAKEQLKSRPEIFIKSVKKVLSSMSDCTVYATNEELDMGTTADKLIMAANLLPEQDREPLIRTLFDTIGLMYPKESSYRKRNIQNMQDAGQNIPERMPQSSQEIPQVQANQFLG